MTNTAGRLVTALLSIAAASIAHAQARATLEAAFVANPEAGSVSMVDVSAKTIVATIDTNPDQTKIERPGTPNYAQDTDVSPDGRTLYVSRGYLGDVAAFDVATGKQVWRRP